MKILCVIDSLGSGGAQRQLVELALGFKEQGHEVSFLVYHQLNFYKKILVENNILVFEIIEPNYLKRLLKMRKFIRGGGYDAVLSFLEAANFISELAGLPRRKWKLIVGERSANPNILKSLKLRAFRWFHLFADYVVANSYENMRMVRKINLLLPKRKCKVIYNMIDLEKWQPAADYTPRKEGKFRLVIAASHQYLKNLNGLVEAVNLLAEKEKDHLIIEWYGDKIKEPFFDNSFPEGLLKIKKYELDNIIKFSPAIKSINEKIQYADAIGLFSFYEGLPNAVCEGMALGKPVIISNVSDNASLIIENKGGFLFNPKEPESIAGAIRKLINLSNEELVKFGNFNRKRATELFNKTAIVNEYLKTFSL
jgi:glycosyltransferase involved in cell wall biosynthesis